MCILVYLLSVNGLVHYDVLDTWYVYQCSFTTSVVVSGDNTMQDVMGGNSFK